LERVGRPEWVYAEQPEGVGTNEVARLDLEPAIRQSSEELEG
jgi:hypothetical protein